VAYERDKGGERAKLRYGYECSLGVFGANRFAENTFENRVFGKNVATGMVAKRWHGNEMQRRNAEFFDLVSTLFRFIFDPVSILD